MYILICKYMYIWLYRLGKRELACSRSHALGVIGPILPPAHPSRTLGIGLR